MTDEIRQDGKVVLSSEDGFFYPDVFQQSLRKELFRRKAPGLYQVYSPRRNGVQARAYRVLSGRRATEDGRNPE